MKKSKRILLTIGAVIPLLATMPLVSSGCIETKKPEVKPNEPKKPESKTPDSNPGLINPNPNPSNPTPAPVPTPEVKPEEKEGYVIYKSTSEDYLKKNNTYYFSKLSYNPVELSDSVYNNQEWKLYRPKMWLSLKMPNKNKPELGPEEQLTKWGMDLNLNADHFTNDYESACGIWNIIRKLAESDENKEGINQGGRFEPKDNESYNEALMRFLKEMDNYLDLDVAFKGLTMDETHINYVTEKLAKDHDWMSKKLIYSADSKMPSTFIREEFNWKSIDKIAETNQNPFVKELISDYEKAMYEGWTV